jgi:hypothetical protein
VGGVVANTFVNVQPNTTIKVVYVLIGGTSLSALRETANIARAKLGEVYRPAAPDLSGLFFCEGEDLVLRPAAEGTYAFYQDEALQKLLYEGRDFRPSQQMLGEQVFVVKKGDLLNSLPAAVRIERKEGIGLTQASETVLEAACEVNGWTYFREKPGSPAALAIQKDPEGLGRNRLDHVHARISTLPSGYYVKGEEGEIYPSKAAFAMGRYWNLVLGAGDTIIDPIKVRFYYNPLEVKRLEQAASEWVLTYFERGTATVPRWVTTQGQVMAPHTQLSDSGLMAPHEVVYPAEGKELGIAYAQFEQVQRWGGGGLLLNVYAAPLPLSITYFEGEASEQVRLRWGSEMTFSTAFHVEKSLDGRNFRPIERIPASPDTKEYSFEEKEPFSQNAYYRLSWQEENGEHAYSKVLYLEARTSAKTLKATLRDGYLNIQWANAAMHTAVQLCDVQGRIWAGDTRGEHGTTMQLSIGALPKGFYVWHWRQLGANGKWQSGAEKIMIE